MLFLVDNRMLSVSTSTLTMGGARCEKEHRIPFCKNNNICVFYY